jgi:hypothetical protein
MDRMGWKGSSYKGTDEGKKFEGSEKAIKYREKAASYKGTDGGEKRTK